MLSVFIPQFVMIKVYTKSYKHEYETQQAEEKK